MLLVFYLIYIIQTSGDFVGISSESIDLLAEIGCVSIAMIVITVNIITV